MSAEEDAVDGDSMMMSMMTTVCILAIGGFCNSVVCTV